MRYCFKKNLFFYLIGQHVSAYGHPKTIFFFFRWRYSPLWALACRTIPLHLSLSITNSFHLLTPNTWRSLYTSYLHLFLGLPLRLVPSSSWVKNFLGILSSSILSRWPSQHILCYFPWYEIKISHPSQTTDHILFLNLLFLDRKWRREQNDGNLDSILRYILRMCWLRTDVSRATVNSLTLSSEVIDIFHSETKL